MTGQDANRETLASLSEFGGTFVGDNIKVITAGLAALTGAKVISGLRKLIRAT